MTEVAMAAMAAFFATIGPLDVAAMFAVLTAKASPSETRKMAIRGILIAGFILIIFALLGESILNGLGISLAALRTGGGILLLLIGIDMTFARDSGGTSTTDDENAEASDKEDIAVFPLATPLIAGPGSIGSAILLMANAEGDITHQAVVLGALIAMLLLTFIMLLLASKIQSLLGVTGMHVISRIFGVLLSALAVQFIFDGIRTSGLLPIN